MVIVDASSPSSAQQWVDQWPLVAAEPDDDDDRPYGVHPIAAYVLHQLLEAMSDDWTEEDAGVLTRDLFPPSLGIWLLDDDFTRRMARSCLELSSRLVRGGQQMMTICTADEINLAIASRLAIDTGYDLFIDDDVLEALLELVGPIDIADEIELARELLSHDADVDHLWNPALDGIENDDELLSATGMAHFHPSQWFEPFWPEETG